MDNQNNKPTSDVITDKTDPRSPYYTPAPKLSEEQNLERAFDMMRLYSIAQVRESPWPQFDGMGYMKYNETNEMADISFMPPKKNKGDTRITSGITHEKDSSLVSFYLNLNFEGDVRLFYKNKELYDMGTTLTKIVRKSREEEEYDRKRAMNYRNYTAQGTAFTREQYTEIWVPNKEIIGDVDPNHLDQVKWVDKGLTKLSARCETILVDGKKVFLENIREPDIQKQQGVYTVEYILRELAQAIWGRTEMWQYVPYMASAGGMAMGSLTQGSIYSDWVWGEVDYTKLEMTQVYRPFEQRYQLYLNGIPMLPTKFPLKAVSPAGLVPLAKGDEDLMNMFAYSKSEPAKTKIDQAVFDELLQTMVMKSRQAAMVPRANNTGKLMTPDMFLGGRLITNLNPEDAPPLIQNPGITDADFSFYQLFKEHIDSKTISSLLEGNKTNNADMTLGQYMDMQKKQMLKIGGKIDGIIQWEKQMLRLRVMNLLANAAQKNPDGSYKDISMEDNMADGTKGLNVIRFDENNIRSPYQVHDEQRKFQEQNGTPVEYTYIDPVLARAIIDDPDYYLCYEIVPVDKNNDKLAQAMYVGLVTQAANLFGMDSLQVSNIKKRFAQKFGETFDDLFISDQELQMKQQQAMQMASQQQGGAGPGAVPSPLNSPIGNAGGQDAMVQKMFS